MKNLPKWLLGSAYVLLVFISFASLVDLYDKREQLKAFFNNNFGSNYVLNEDDIYWANEIMNGGYILHFRHAERDKWIDVQMYDALESDLQPNGLNGTRYAENDYFDRAVCLNDRGKVQGRAMGESIEHIGLPIGYVVSSVSCRARQTADLAFGGYDRLERILVHAGPYNENEKERVDKLKDLYKNLEMQDGKNAIVSAHNSVVSCKMFENNACPQDLELEEGGFYILSKTDKGLRFEYEFHNFNDFNKIFYER
tara:strand:+ start:285 stop:1046 length:762 start_codon:yes stop_codon:yes gene_type:complete